MASEHLPDPVRRYIFEHIDSVEQLEILLFLKEKRGNAFNANEIAAHLRINPKSAANRLTHLRALSLISAEPEDYENFKYSPATPELDELIRCLSEEYKIRKHRVLEAIFSPMKRARQFADAFTLTKKNDQGSEGNDG